MTAVAAACSREPSHADRAPAPNRALAIAVKLTNAVDAKGAASPFTLAVAARWLEVDPQTGAFELHASL